MSRMTVDELIYLLEFQDPELKFLFVEGVSDSRFWSIVVPFSERNDVTVAPIEVIEIDIETGGDRGRLLELARRLEGSSVSEQVLFWVDADNHYIEPSPTAERVVFTDNRDFEGYVYDPICCRALCYALGKDPDEKHVLVGLHVGELRQIGILRAASESVGANLPFNAEFSLKPKGCIDKSTTPPGIIWEKLLGRLFAVAKTSKTDQDTLLAVFQVLSERSIVLSDAKIVSARDFRALLSASLKISLDEVAIAIRGALASSLPHLRGYRNFGVAEAFVRS